MSIPLGPETPAAMTELLYWPSRSNRASSCANIPPAMTEAVPAHLRGLDRGSPLRQMSKPSNKWMHLTRSARGSKPRPLQVIHVFYGLGRATGTLDRGRSFVRARTGREECAGLLGGQQYRSNPARHGATWDASNLLGSGINSGQAMCASA